jgi:hypothetical protein
MKSMSARMSGIDASASMQSREQKVENRKNTMDGEFEVGTKGGAPSFVGMFSSALFLHSGFRHSKSAEKWAKVSHTRHGYSVPIQSQQDPQILEECMCST